MKKNKQIVLVEDDPDIMEIYRAMLQKAGFDVNVISLGGEVIKLMGEVQAGEAQKPGLVLLDLTLPDMNGMDVLAHIRGGSNTKDITVFILTNQQESETTHPAGVKADKFIIKANITPTDLVGYVQEALK